MGEIYSYIRNIGYFMIFSAVVRMIAPQGSFRAYINLFLGLMFMVVMMNPLSRFIKTDLPELQDYILKNEITAGEEIFGSDRDKNINIIKEEYTEALEERIKELCSIYIENTEVSIQTDAGFNVTAVYIKGKAVKDTTELKRIISEICCTGEENVLISGEWEE